MKLNKQPKRASKAGMPEEKQLPATDVAPEAARGGDKESKERLRKQLQGSAQPRTSPGRKPGR